MVRKCIPAHAVRASDIVTLYILLNLINSAALQPLSGKIYQYYSSKVPPSSLYFIPAVISNFSAQKAFLTGVAIFEIGSLMSGAANSSNTMITGRAIAGVGGSGLLTGLLTILASSTPLEKRPSMSLKLYTFWPVANW